MARRIKDASLDSKAARRKLTPRSKPYWRSVERGLHVGYRRHADRAGPWIVRQYIGDQQYREEAVGIDLRVVTSADRVTMREDQAN